MSAARAASKTSSTSKKSAPAGSDRIGRGTRWTEEQVKLLMDSVKRSATAREAFESVAKQLGKSSGTVQQKYYNLQKKQAGGGAVRRGRPAGARAGAPAKAAANGRAARERAAGASGPLGATELRSLTVDELVGLATRVRSEIDRRRQELDAASKLLKG